MRKHILAVLFVASALCTTAFPGDMDTIRFSIGMKYMNEKQYEKAVEEFRKMLTLYPDHAPSYFRIGACWRALGKNALAIYNLKKAAKYDPKDAEIQRELAEACFANGEAEAALSAMRKGIELEADPAKKAKGEERARVMLEGYKNAPPPALPETTAAKTDTASATAEAAEAEEEEAAETEEEAKTPSAKDAFSIVSKNRHSESSADPLMKPILDAYNAGQYGKALSAARDLLKKKPGHPGAYYYGGVVRYYNKEPDKAAINFRQAFSYPEKGYNAHYYLGLINEKAGKKTEAVKEYEQYINLTTYEPGKEEAKDRLSKLLKLMGKNAPAPAASAPVAEESRKAPLVFSVTADESFLVEDTTGGQGKKLTAALDLFLDEKYDAALKALKELYREHPRDSQADNALYNTGLVYYRMRLWAEALEYLSRAVREYPAGDAAGPAQLLLGRVLFDMGRLDSSAAAFEKYLSSRPRDGRYAYVNARLGDVAFARNDSKEALKYYLKALGAEKDPSRKIDLDFRVGECYWRQGSDRGIEYFLQAVSADTALHSEAVRESCFRLGDYYFRLKNLESALKYYRIAVDRFPSSPQSGWAFYQMGNIYKMGGQTEEAIKTYERLIQAYPGDYWAVRAKWKKEDAVWESEYRDILQ